VYVYICYVSEENHVIDIIGIITKNTNFLLAVVLQSVYLLIVIIFMDILDTVSGVFYVDIQFAV